MKKKVAKRKAPNKKLNLKNCNTPNASGCGGCAYFIGFIGAAVYYIQNATGFGNGLLGVLKALVWPAILVYKLLGFLGA